MYFINKKGKILYSKKKEKFKSLRVEQSGLFSDIIIKPFTGMPRVRGREKFFVGNHLDKTTTMGSV